MKGITYKIQKGHSLHKWGRPILIIEAGVDPKGNFLGGFYLFYSERDDYLTEERIKFNADIISDHKAYFSNETLREIVNDEATSRFQQDVQNFCSTYGHMYSPSMSGLSTGSIKDLTILRGLGKNFNQLRKIKNTTQSDDLENELSQILRLPVIVTAPEE
jgi:hypothetical protein